MNFKNFRSSLKFTPLSFFEKRSFVFFQIYRFVFVLQLTGCHSPFPSDPKPNVPEDHTVTIATVLHKEGYDYPYRESSGCAVGYCHGNGLDGGVADIDDRISATPSCFQCHNTKWEDDVDEAQKPVSSQTDISFLKKATEHE